MSAITFRVFAAIAGALLGLGAFVLACQALVVALTQQLGTIGGLMAAAGILLLLAVVAFWVVSRPSPEVEAEAEEAKSAAAGLLAGLPGDAIMSMIRKHPVTVLLAAVMLGYTMIRDPGKAMRQVQSMVLALL